MNDTDHLSTTAFSAAELDRFAAIYRDDGVVHIPGLLGRDWVQRLVSVLSQARQTLTGSGESASGLAPGSRRLSGMRTAEFSSAPGRFTIRWLWRDLDTVRRFFTDSGVAPVVAAVIGAKRLQYWYDLTFIHDPNAEGAGSPWHHDIAAFPCKGAQIPSLWIAMSDITRDMSPLQCIRGSHRIPTMFRPPVHIDPHTKEPPGYVTMPDVKARIASGEYECITWEVKEGDALLIHPHTLHGAPVEPLRSHADRVHHPLGGR